jgi:hypothetical protein
LSAGESTGALFAVVIEAYVSARVSSLDALRGRRAVCGESSVATRRKASLPPTCEDSQMRVVVEFEWRELGALRLESGRLRFPEVPDVPGVYRLHLSDRVYIGEADRLRRRFQHYRTPGPRQATNLRLNSLMLELLRAAGTIDVYVSAFARVEVDGHAEPLDMRHKAARLLVESAALTAARMAGQAVENL